MKGPTVVIMPRSPSSRDNNRRRPSVVEADEFYRAVYSLVRQIPHGRVCTYGKQAHMMHAITTPIHCSVLLAATEKFPWIGHIARLARRPAHSRLVGQALKHLAPRLSSPYIDPAEPERGPNPDFVPWHRVVNASGIISPRGSVRAVTRQANMLREEGVQVRDGPREGGEGWERNDVFFGLAAVEGGRVRLSEFGWFPQVPEDEDEDEERGSTDGAF
jgi:alkylated DNA nucleotide flippase Atl1